VLVTKKSIKRAEGLSSSSVLPVTEFKCLFFSYSSYVINFPPDRSLVLNKNIKIGMAASKIKPTTGLSLTKNNIFNGMHFQDRIGAI
jgi:hypothetical protein